MSSSHSWLDIPTDSPFSLANIPFGIITTQTSDAQRVPAIAIGNHVLDLNAFGRGRGFSALPSIALHSSVFAASSLNAFAALGRPAHREVRKYLQDMFKIDTPYPHLLKDNNSLRQAALVSRSSVINHLPLETGDYTDFFAGRNHAFNVGSLFRGPENALQPNYVHLPVGYHGRASSVVVSGTALRRPWGQILLDPKADLKIPTFAPCKRLDIELEMAMFVCTSNELGQPVPITEAESHIFGYALMNDWSARDIQTWEYVPLGPFNAKNFGTSISPWVVLADALEPFRTKGLKNEAELQPYLRESREDGAFDIDLKVELTTASGNTTNISNSNTKYLLWSWPQMLTHHTVGGCNLQTGDLFGSGTISGFEDGTHGSILEMTHGGKDMLQLSGGEQRKFLEDGDVVTIRGQAGKEGQYVGFGEVAGKIEPAVERITNS